VKAVSKKKGWYQPLLKDLVIAPLTEDEVEKAAREKANDDAYIWLFLST
jgi:hypothetical protein